MQLRRNSSSIATTGSPAQHNSPRQFFTLYATSNRCDVTATCTGHWGAAISDGASHCTTACAWQPCFVCLFAVSLRRRTRHAAGCVAFVMIARRWPRHAAAGLSPPRWLAACRYMGVSQLPLPRLPNHHAAASARSWSSGCCDRNMHPIN